MSIIPNCCYYPTPPRVWSRVQNACSFGDPSYSSTTTYISPLSGKTISQAQYNIDLAMLRKGNVLQYKINSSSLTQKQRYSKIANGAWTNRNTTWANQSTRGYTNPNIQSLQRVNTINITLDGTPTNLPVTCPKQPIVVYSELPPQSDTSNPETELPPPPPPPADTGDAIPVVPIPVAPDPVVIQDLGNMLCNVYQNICTGETISHPANIPCHPTTDSDVPGAIEELCWNDGIQTWYPRQRYVMTNSGDKFPQGYKLLVSAIKPCSTI